jgi:hypothetical protein
MDTGTKQETKEQRLNRLKHEAREKSTLKEDKHILIAVQEIEKYDWHPAARLLLLILVMGTRNKADAWIQPDCRWTAEECVGWCDMSQWRLAQRTGLTERQVQRILDMFKADGAIERRHWRDSNGALHTQYRVNEEYIRLHERPSHKFNTPRPPRYKEGSRKANGTSFTRANQPGKNRGAREMDDE